jgi:hypothetical protein
MKREVLYKIPSLCLEKVPEKEKAKKEEYKFMAKAEHPEKSRRLHSVLHLSKRMVE